MSLRILFLSHYFHPKIGGIEKHSEILASQIAGAGHEVHLVTWTTEVSDKVFPFVIIRNPGRHQLIKEHRWADVVFENNPSVRLAWPQFFLKRPLIIALHTWISRTDGRKTWIDRLKTKRLSGAKKVIACSNAVRSQCWPEAMVIENPYQEDVFKILPDVLKRFDFVFLGRLVSDKGASLAVRAIHKLIQSEVKSVAFQNLRFTIVGNGPERENLEKLVSELRIEKNVTFTGSLKGEELVQCLNEHRFLLVPSVWEEPFGMVALEGMACGCVPIASDSGGLPEAVGKAGLTFEKGNVDSLVNTLQKVLNNQELVSELRKAAETHLSLHKQEIISKRYLKVIEEAV